MSYILLNPGNWLRYTSLTVPVGTSGKLLQIALVSCLITLMFSTDASVNCKSLCFILYLFTLLTVCRISVSVAVLKSSQEQILTEKLKLKTVNLTLRHHNPYGINSVFKYAVDISRKETGYYEGNQSWHRLCDYLRENMGRPYLLGSKRPGKTRRYAVVRTLTGVIRIQFRKPSDRLLFILTNA